MQKVKDKKQEQYRHSLAQQAMSLKHCMYTNSRIQIVRSETEISCKIGMQQNNVFSKRN